MSDLSEAIARAEKRMEGMTDDERFKLHVPILREELQRQSKGKDQRSDHP